MTVSMYNSDCQSSCNFDRPVRVYRQSGSAYRGEATRPELFLNMRLASDMYPYARQVQQASTHAARCCSALAGMEMPNMPNTEASFAELKARLAKTISLLQNLQAGADRWHRGQGHHH